MNILHSFHPWDHAPRRAAAKTGARPVEASPDDLDRALQCLEAGDGAGAFAALRQLADCGHPAAARMALMLVKRGSSLFGGSYPASTAEMLRWQRCSER